jgi:hypothetical protein
MIDGGVAVSDDGLLVFPIFSEIPEQRFAPRWIEVVSLSKQDRFMKCSGPEARLRVA